MSKSKSKAVATRRAADHQAAVLARRASGATQWDRRPRGQRTRADAKRAALRDAA